MDAVAAEHLAEDLRRQVAVVFAHARQGSVHTRRRYRAAACIAMDFFARQFRLRKVANLREKHLRAYVEARLAAGKSTATILTDLSALRYVHNQLPSPRYRLPTNEALGLALSRRQHRNLGRRWSDAEFAAMEDAAQASGQTTIFLVLALCRHAGLRIHEVMRLDWASARRGLRTAALEVTGKGGLVRSVPLAAPAATALQAAFLRVRYGQKLFVPRGMKTHRAIARVQAFILAHRGEVEQPGRQAPLTAHGLRHTYAAARYLARRTAGDSHAQAECTVARELGHRRREVTRVYTS